MQATIYDHTGKEVETMRLPAAIFAVPWQTGLVQRALVRELANARQGTKKTKKRGEVSGGGKKPRRQKGTGRARQGSIRAPQWVGGGVVFGPTGQENYTINMNRKEVRKALYSVLAKQASEGRILGLNDYPYTESKTKQFHDLLHKLPVTRDVLVILPAANQVIEKAARNLPQVKVTTMDHLSVADLLKHDKILCLKEVFVKWQKAAELPTS